MISDESSSESETGRFKGRSKPQDDHIKNSRTREDLRSGGRSRPIENERDHRQFERRRDDRDRFERRSRDRNRYPRYSPARRRYSRDRSPNIKSHDRDRHRPVSTAEISKPRDIKSDSKERSSRDRSPNRKPNDRDRLKPVSSREISKPRDIKSDNKERYSRDRSPNKKSNDHDRHRPISSREISKPSDIKSDSRERQRHSRSQPRKSPLAKKDNVKEEVKYNIREERKPSTRNISSKTDNKSKSEHDMSLSPIEKGKKSVIHKPNPTESQPKSASSITVEQHIASDVSEDVQPTGSYYSLVPTVKKDISEESSEIDSSDDERLRAKLLNLEKELKKTRKKKHKKKHRKRRSKSSKDKDEDASVVVEVSSTTDIDKTDISNTQADVVEVTSTEKTDQRESSEEGEISSGDDSQSNIEIDANDLRHKLKRSVDQEDVNSNPKHEVCGPALPPHLDQKLSRSTSQDTEGPVLPPHLQKQSKRIGPTIPEQMRVVLAETTYDVVDDDSSEDDGIGPLPAGAEDKWSDAHKKLEARALDMKIRTMEGHTMQNTTVKSREEWMLELPEGKAKIIGLEARKFRAKEGPDMSDRSSWTDTPEEKARKAAGIIKEEDSDAVLQKEARARQVMNRDDEQEKAVKKHKKKHKRDDSLLEMHQKKLKKKKKKEEKEDGTTERRPFSRDVDLQVNRFDEAQKKSIIKKAQALDSRFSSGEAKFL